MGFSFLYSSLTLADNDSLDLQVVPKGHHIRQIGMRPLEIDLGEVLFIAGTTSLINPTGVCQVSL